MQPFPDLPWPPPADWPALAKRCGALRIRGTTLDADNRALRTLAASLGAPSLDSLPHRARLVEPGGVARVEALAEATADQYGKPLLSASSAAFALHSDESFQADPARFVLLQCWRPAAQGGQTLLVDVHALLPDLDRVTQIALTQLHLPYAHADAVSVDAHRRVRYNRRECAGAASGRALSATQEHWLDRFDAVFADHAHSLDLHAGDLLVIDNWRVLHGRLSFAADSGRLLKRLRVRADSGYQNLA